MYLLLCAVMPFFSSAALQKEAFWKQSPERLSLKMGIKSEEKLFLDTMRMLLKVVPRSKM